MAEALAAAPIFIALGSAGVALAKKIAMANLRIGLKNGTSVLLRISPLLTSTQTKYDLKIWSYLTKRQMSAYQWPYV